MSQKVTPRPALQTGKGRKRVNDSAGKIAARQSKEVKGLKGGPSGDLGAKKPFNWSPAHEIIALSELVKLANVDAGHSLDNNTIDWEQLALTLGQRLDHNLSRIQVYEKTRRLKERYTKTHKKISRGVPSLKNDNDHKIYKLSQQLWGTDRALSLQLEEEEHGLPPGNLENKSSEVDDHHQHGSSLNDTEVEIVGLNTAKENTSKEHRRDPLCSTERGQGKPNAKNSSPEHAMPLTSLSNIRGIEGDTQKTFDVFRGDHQALLKELEKSCETVLQDMQVKFLTMMNNSVRGGSEISCMGTGGRVPSLDVIMQAPVSWDKMVDKCLAETSTNKHVAFESLYEQWQQQRLQELKLTSLKLQLMLDECKMEQEKLEKQVFKT
eukprot:c20840_g1_i1 orf=471-1607(+)